MCILKPQAKLLYFYVEEFFSKVDVLPERVNILNGNAPDLEAECESYETASNPTVALIFLGEKGSIAFNEPGSSLTSRTRMKI